MFILPFLTVEAFKCVQLKQVQLFFCVNTSILSSVITCFPAAAAKDLVKLQRLIRYAEGVIGRPQDSVFLYTTAIKGI